jgi:hypothetical protein
MLSSGFTGCSSVLNVEKKTTYAWSPVQIPIHLPALHAVCSASPLIPVHLLLEPRGQLQTTGMGTSGEVRKSR